MTLWRRKKSAVYSPRRGRANVVVWYYVSSVRIGQHRNVAYMFSSFFQIYTRRSTHAAIFHATPLNLIMNRCSTTISIRTKRTYRKCMFAARLCVWVCVCMDWQRIHHAVRWCVVVHSFMNRLYYSTQWETDRERANRKDRRGEKVLCVNWIRTKRSHFAFSAGKISVHKRIRLWANILNKFCSSFFFCFWIEQLKWIPWIAKLQLIENTKFCRKNVDTRFERTEKKLDLFGVVRRKKSMNCGCSIRSNEWR